jgi:phenylalanyl-tRNA synthetase beta chain
MVGRAILGDFGEEEKGAPTLLNPLSEEQAVLRTTLLPGLTSVLVRNFHRQVRDMAVFELGKIFLLRPGEKLPVEGERLAVAAMGSTSAHWRRPYLSYDFYYMKGLFLTVFQILGLPEPEIVAAIHPAFHPGRCVAVHLSGTAVGFLGELHPSLCAKLGIPGPLAAGELDLNSVLSSAGGVPRYQSWSRVPAVERDLSLVVATSVPAGAVQDAIRRHGGALLQNISLFDLYVDDKIGPGTRSLTFNLLFGAQDRTLTDDEVNAAVQNIIAGLATEMGVGLRN